MSVLTRRDRIAKGGTQGGVLYFGSYPRWPERGPFIFELFATHAHAATDPGDLITRQIHTITTWDGDGTTKLYTGYGSLSANVEPLYVVPLNLDGTWDDPIWEHRGYEMIQWVHWSDGQLMCCAGDGPADWLRARPSVGGAPPVWVDGWCSPSGYIHPLTMVEHDGYMWVCGGSFAGSVWRGTHEWGNDGEFVLTPLVGWFNNCMFSYQDKLWFQENNDGASPTFLKYWVEATESWVTTGIQFGGGYCEYIFPWGSVMLVVFDNKLWSFNGTTVTQRYSGTNVTMLHIDPDNNVWICEGGHLFRKSSDLVTWTTVSYLPNPADSMHIHEDILYVGDTTSHIWRTHL